MNKEILSLETAEKLARYEKAIKYMKHYIKVEPNNGTTMPIKIEFTHVLKLLEVKNEIKQSRKHS